MNIIGFDWDKGNSAKCSKHGIAIEEIVAFFHQKELFITFDPKHSDDEQRFIAVGRMPNGKPGTVVFTLREGYIRPISARYMHEKEIRRYKKIHSTLKNR
jgi:uncharacterized DUF497 family protein